MSAYLLNSETKTLATLLAQNSFAKYQHVRGHYRNSYSSHYVGKIGELAAFIWLRDAGLNPVLNVIDPKADKLCDIETDVGRIEVKTWKEKHWDDLGRAITVSQLSSIQKKADVVLWVVARRASRLHQRMECGERIRYERAVDDWSPRAPGL
jgi:hypothetical protein